MSEFKKLEGRKIKSIETRKGVFDDECCYLILRFDDGIECSLWPTIQEGISIEWSDK